MRPIVVHTSTGPEEPGQWGAVTNDRLQTCVTDCLSDLIPSIVPKVVHRPWALPERHGVRAP
jgi:hypothetical protein